MYHKIQPEQIQLHNFSSPSGDLNFDIGQNYVYTNLSRFLTGDFDIQGQLSINGSPIFASDSTNAATGLQSFSIGGTNNNISGDQNGFVNSYSSNSLGNGNLGLNGRFLNFSSGTSDNTILAGRNINFETGVTGSTAIKDQEVTSLDISRSQSLIISFNSGIFFENGDVAINGGDFCVGSSNSGLFSGNLHALGTIFENGVPVATTGDLGVTSGTLNTRISETGAYSVAASGNLSNNILNTGLYAVATSGILDAKIISTGNYAVATSGLLNARIISTGQALTSSSELLSGILSNRLINTGLYSIIVSGNLATDLLNTGLYAVASSGLLNTSIASTGAYAVASSGLLNTSIASTGAYAVASSGLLNTSIASTGAYAVASSGLLNTRMNTSVFRTGTQIISGEKTFHQNLNLAQSVIISGASGILSGATARTQFIPASSGDSVGNRGLIAYSGQFLYLKISDNPHIWARHSGTINWP